MTAFQDRKNNLKIRKGEYCDRKDIHIVLLEAFKSYKKYYTSKAFNATILTPAKIKNRLKKKDTIVLVILHNKAIVGTVTLLCIENILSIMSMAVKPDFQGTGIGRYILEEIIKYAEERHIKVIVLESFLPLTKAMNLYNHFGFIETGNKRNFYGIEIVEMKKEMK